MTMRFAPHPQPDTARSIRYFDPLSHADTDWLRLLTMPRSRPNVLVDCSWHLVPPVLAQLGRVCASPIAVCRTPGDLCLPADYVGTAVVHDASTLTIEQQIQLFDWMSARRDAVQVIALTTTPLWALVERGHFLEGLFHRLNMVHVCATRRQVSERRRFVCGRTNATRQ